MGCLLVHPLGFPPVLVAVFLSVIREKASRHKGKSEPKVGIKNEMWEPFPYFHRECREIIHQHGGFLSVYCKNPLQASLRSCRVSAPESRACSVRCGKTRDGRAALLRMVYAASCPVFRKKKFRNTKNPGQKVWKFCPGEEMVSRCIRIPRFRRCRISSRCQRRKWSRWRV